MSGPKHTPTPARDAALSKAWAEHPELGNEERSAFIYGFEAGWNAAAPHLAAALERCADALDSFACDPPGFPSVEWTEEDAEAVREASAALREAGVS